jgi:hypothetical protein
VLVLHLLFCSRMFYVYVFDKLLSALLSLLLVYVTVLCNRPHAVVHISRENKELNVIIITIIIELKLLFQPVYFIACYINFQISK